MPADRTKKVSCPKCGTLMEYWVEIEIGNGYKRIKYYYRCPRCGYRLMDEALVIRRNGENIVIEKEEYRLAIPRQRVGRR